MPLPLAKPEEIGLDGARLEVAYRLLESWTKRPDGVANNPVPGGAIVVGRKGKLVAPRLFGFQGPEDNAEPIRRDAMFLLASITKPVVYMAGLMLVERGLLNLTDPVARYIPDFAAHHKEDVLVAHLFTHTSGLPDMLPADKELRANKAPLAKFIEGAVRDTMLAFPAGTDFSYQSMGTLVVAELVQQLSGRTIHDFVRREILEPLELRSTGLGSRGFDPIRLVRVQTPPWQDKEFGWNSPYWRELGAPWGGMFSSPEDFAVICHWMLSGGKVGNVRLLSQKTVRMATTNRLDDFPNLPEPVRRTNGWGLGWAMNHPGKPSPLCDLLGSRAFGHTGSTGTLVWMDPESETFCLLLTSAERSRAPWRLVHLSNIVASAIV